MKKLIASISIIVFFLISCKQEVYYTISTQVLPEEGGTIVVTPSSGSVLDGTSVSFTASPKGDYVFTGWSGSLSGTENPKTVTVTSDLNVTANFELKTYPLIVSVEGEGAVNERVISTKADYGSGTVVELTAQPSEHWLFDHWEGDLNGNTNPVQIAITSPKTVKAVFVKKMYDLTVITEGEGAVSETVKETKSGSYQEGTVVELTATPATGWSFNHWEGDLSGADNPTQITLTGEKYVKAVFAKNKYSYNLKIVGPGVVDEYLLPETKADFDYGTKILLKAIPSEGAVFKGWSGDLSGIQPEMEVGIEQDLVIVASFDKSVKQYPLLDLTTPTSYRKQLYYGLDFSGLSWYPTGFLAVDYNQDGYVDVVTCNTQYTETGRSLIEFYLGQHDGSYIKDERNSDKFMGLISGRKSFYGDFNGDGIPDICFVGHGWDEEPWPGEYPVLLYSVGDGLYEEMRFVETVGYFHGSAAGDFDNDGDLDIFLLDHSTNSWFLVNDGNGNFTKSNTLYNQSMIDGSLYTTEMFDINHDGFLDLIVGGHEHEGHEWHKYTNTTTVFWGNGDSFNHNNYDRFPRFIDGYGVTLDYCFYDLDGDGWEEIINVRTGDGFLHPSYCGWAFQIVSYDGTSFSDVTSKFINDFENGCSEGSAYCWIDIEEIDEEIYLCARRDTNSECLYLLKNGRFVRVDDEIQRYPTQTGGYTIFSGERTMQSGWGQYASFVFSFQNGLDLSLLVEQDYCLEIYLQNTDPSLMFDYHFDVLPNGAEDGLIYGSGVEAQDLKNDGSWECVRVPLQKFDLWSDSQDKENYWNKVTQFVLITTSHGGEEFSVKDIRIRKVIETD